MVEGGIGIDGTEGEVGALAEGHPESKAVLLPTANSVITVARFMSPCL
jgi:hypothetical protein